MKFNMSSHKHILIVVGTRPEATKFAPVIKALQNDPRFTCTVCSTGQHKEMLTQTLNWFGITPDITMDVMTHNQPLAQLAGRILNGLDTIIKESHPNVIMVQGDTTTAFIGALAGYYNYNFFKHHPVEVAHIEAGLRTYNPYAPYPEEGNRSLIARIANYHFAPTFTAAEALFEEGVTNNVFITGNTVIDALLETVNLIKTEKRPLPPEVPTNGRMILVTGHRRENYGDGFQNICIALKELAHLYPNDNIVYPVHLNPFVKKPVEEYLSNIPNVHLLKPLDYPDFINTMMHSHIVLTDSGGLQEEAPSLGKPVLVMRDVTERPDAVNAGTVKLVGTDTQKIITATRDLMENKGAYQKMAQAINPYGDANATRRILNLLAGERAEENENTWAPLPGKSLTLLKKRLKQAA